MSATRISRTRRGLMGLSVIGLVVGLMGALVIPAFGVDVHEPHIGTICDEGGLWHFVHNQIPADTPAGELTATFSITGEVTVTANKVLNSTQHYDVIAAGELLAASDDIAEGKLVLSHVDCDETTTTTDPTTTSSSIVDTTSTTKPDTTTTTKPDTTTTSTKPDTTTSTTKADTTTTSTKPDTTTSTTEPDSTTSSTKPDSTTSSTRHRPPSTTKPPSTTTTDGKNDALTKWLGDRSLDRLPHVKNIG